MALATAVLIAGSGLAFTRVESYSSLYDAEYVGNAKCGECHTQVYAEWASSPHAKMVREPSKASVVGDFDNHEYVLPPEFRRGPQDDQPVARMTERDGQYFVGLRDPNSADRFIDFKVDYVVGFQYRQTYLHKEANGVIRRLPLQWSVDMNKYFSYWNFQEGSAQSLDDFWAQMRSQNSAWNLFCARCHVTKLNIHEKTQDHTAARTDWVENGIGCEACHGPGSHHVNYFEGSYVNRIAAFLNSKVRGQPVAYIANAPKLTRGQAMSVCGRCHGPDIMMSSTDAYRTYEPGYSREGRLNDLSPHFKEFPLQPGRKDPTVECWDDGRPKGIAMLFRSFIESACYEQAEVRCYDCHQVHANKFPRKEGLLIASQQSNDYCLNCHENLRHKVAEHTHHTPGDVGSFCYDCHMPRNIQNIVGGYEKFVRTHTMSSIPDPAATIKFGRGGAPNACNDCHKDESPQWALEKMEEWWGGASGP